MYVLLITCAEAAMPSGVMELGVQEGLTRSLYAAHNGVYRMSPDIEDLVEFNDDDNDEDLAWK